MTKLTETAPERIWLQISDDESDNDEVFPCVNGNITWEGGSVLSAEVAYVRAGLLEAAQKRIAELETEVDRLRENWKADRKKWAPEGIATKNGCKKNHRTQRQAKTKRRTCGKHGRLERD